MKRTHVVKALFMGLAGMFLTTITNAQGKESPPETASGTVAGAKVTINYGSPSVKGRTIFGGLLPYGKVWRAGANEATTLETDKDITVEGKKLPKGKYTLFATPGEKEWTIILNSQTGQWGIKRSGDANRDAANDVVTATVTPKKSASLTEKLTYEVTSTGFVLRWENVEVPITIK